MKKYLQIINIRTFQVLLICFVISFLAIRYHIVYDFDFTIISIAIIFPLVFTIRAAFRRREKALEHLSRFKSGLTTVYHCFQVNKKLDEEKKLALRNMVLELSTEFHKYLGKGSVDQTLLRTKEDAIFQYIQSNKEFVKASEAFKIFRFMKDVHSAIENTLAIDSHRTPISLRAYCQIFIYFFPVIYTPALLDRLGHNATDWAVYSLSMITGFIMISLYNVQDQMENPFDNHGLDDIKMESFKLNI